MVKGRRKYGTHKNVTKTTVLSMCNNDISSPVNKQRKFDTDKRLKDKSNSVTIQSVSKTYESPVCKTYSHNKDLVIEIRKEKSAVLLTSYFYRNAQELPNCVQMKNDVSDVEQFKTDETPVAVPIHGPSTPHRINMPSENLHEESAIITKDKQSVMVALRSPLQIIKKPARRKKVATNHLINHRSVKPTDVKSTNHSITDYFPVRRSVRKCKKTVLEEKQRDFENKVLCQSEEGLEVRYFPGKGRGVITTREFAKGEFVVEYIGELINQGEAKEREKIYAQDQNTGCYMYYFQHRNQQYCVDATAETDKLGRLVNHSRIGNLVARIIEVSSIPHLVLTAKEDIPSGVEIAYDYGDRSRESIRNHPWLAL